MEVLLGHSNTFGSNLDVTGSKGKIKTLRGNRILLTS